MKLNNYRIIFKLILSHLAAPLEDHWGPLVGRDPPVGNPCITLPPLCFRWACMFGIMSRSFFLQTLAFPSLWSIKSVHKTLSQNFRGSSPILLANEWFASSGVASVLLFMKSSANSRLWYLHYCSLEVVADVTSSCFRVFLYSCHNVSVVNCWCFPWSTRSRCVT